MRYAMDMGFVIPILRQNKQEVCPRMIRNQSTKSSEQSIHSYHHVPDFQHGGTATPARAGTRLGRWRDPVVGVLEIVVPGVCIS